MSCKCADNQKSTIENEEMLQTPQKECPTIVHETVCVQADVSITPNVTVGEIKSTCVGGAIIGQCAGTPSPDNECTFTVSQSICVQVPLTFSADATAEPTGIVCGTPQVGEC